MWISLNWSYLEFTNLYRCLESFPPSLGCFPLLPAQILPYPPAPVFTSLPTCFCLHTYAIPKSLRPCLLFKKIVFISIHLFCVCRSLGCMLHSVRMWRSEDNLQESVLSFHRVGHKDGAWSLQQTPCSLHRGLCSILSTPFAFDSSDWIKVWSFPKLADSSLPPEICWFNTLRKCLSIDLFKPKNFYLSLFKV